MGRIYRFLGLTEHDTSTDRTWNKQSNPELSERVRDRLRADFADGDHALADRLGRTLPWAQARRQ